MEFFGFTGQISEFAKQWKALTPQDQADLKRGLEDGTLNY